MAISVKVLSIIAIVCVVELTYLVYITVDVNDSKRYPIQDKRISNNKTKYILYWTTFWTQIDFAIGLGSKIFKNCEYNNCFATNNRTFRPIEKFDALIFHAMIYNKKSHRVPSKRLPQQIYVYANLEAPVHACPDLKPYNSFYNWTLSYRFDSDIVRRHGNVIKGETNYTFPSEEALEKKTKLVAWFASNCNTDSQREILVKKLQNYIPVDIYGECGTLKCPRRTHRKISPGECYDKVEEQYKFYLSFENSYCKDYATEKLYNLLLRNVVPVVYGDGSYIISTPPNSVINVADFKNVSNLADYLKYLDRNKDEYLKYFKWKKKYTITPAQQATACQICKKLNQPLNQKIYKDLYNWWWGDKAPVCKNKKDLPTIIIQ